MSFEKLCFKYLGFGCICGATKYRMWRVSLVTINVFKRICQKAERLTIPCHTIMTDPFVLILWYSRLEICWLSNLLKLQFDCHVIIGWLCQKGSYIQISSLSQICSCSATDAWNVPKIDQAIKQNEFPDKTWTIKYAMEAATKIYLCREIEATWKLFFKTFTFCFQHFQEHLREWNLNVLVVDSWYVTK